MAGMHQHTVTSRPTRQHGVQVDPCLYQEHVWRKCVNGQWRCGCCFALHVGLPSERQSDKCPGRKFSQGLTTFVSGFVVMSGHYLWQTGEYTWCARCGAYCSVGGWRASKKLKSPCIKVLARAHRERLLLAQGRKPTGCGRTGVFLAAPYRIAIAKWNEIMAAQYGRTLPRLYSDEYVQDLVNQLAMVDLNTGPRSSSECVEVRIGSL